MAIREKHVDWFDRACDSGRGNLPVGGQLISPLVAMKSPH